MNTQDTQDIPNLNDPRAVPTDPYRGRAHPIHNLPIKVETHAEDIPTESHALAVADHEEKGAAQLDHGNTEVRDLGWNDQPDDVPVPLVGGLPNEQLWTLVRRFNKQMYHVKSLPEPPIGGLDLNIADEEEFSPDKLRANIERLYMTVIVGLVTFWKHIARLRSWRERNRTILFATVYFLAWLIDFLVPTVIGFMVVLIAWPPSREYCFPPAPPALIDSTTGGIKKPTAGVLGNDTSLTGAPEKHQGEAVEQEASNFVNSITSIAISSAAGKHPQGDPNGDEAGASTLEDASPDPTNMAVGAADAKSSSEGNQINTLHDKTKEPMRAAMWSKTRPVMHAIADISDGWERFANALSPTPPFPQQKPRLKLAGCLAPLLLISMFTSSYMFMKMNGLFVGLGFFGDPLIWRGLSYLNREFPHWQRLLEIRNTLLKGVPTNAQLTITLLRIGEANEAPIPPPPSSSLPPSDVAHATAGEDLDHLGVSDAEMAHAIHPNVDANTASVDQPKPKKKGHRILAAFKSVTKGGVETVLGTDRLKAAVGAEHAKNRLGVLKDGPDDPAGPTRFPCRYKGKKGHAYITATTTTPALSWTTERDDIDPVFSIPISDIMEIKKVGGLGWKTRLVVGWATSREIADGLLVVDKAGDQKLLTAIALREELFNRLISIGPQMWEAW
ncbi:caab79d3-ed60-4df6-a6cd-90c860cd7cb2 [Sclerotinia trifoliorum]|uniref:Caab79d3-ed60-4df6-a6cd-90c860cd7cb2 n=1 Tax=Sclerotinia trifoliorum TaxID=28548 RepID=A0A8H2W3K4_9HELO|nr:caab79d3-ed60-4df6-a6cd-90c860cd7cb2 [Sclerotinia trifoliorum]